MSCLRIQVRVIAAFLMVISSGFLVLNLKILLKLIFKQDEIKEEDLKDYNLSELIVLFFIRVIYLFGETLLSIFLNIWVYKDNASGLIMWFTMTIIFSIASRCYFIGGIMWGQFFVITVITFSGNLAFTLYSLVVVYYYIKKLISGQEEESREYVSNYYEMV